MASRVVVVADDVQQDESVVLGWVLSDDYSYDLEATVDTFVLLRPVPKLHGRSKFLPHNPNHDKRELRMPMIRLRVLK